MGKSLEQRIDDSFPLESEIGTREFEQGQKYLEALRVNWSNESSALSRAGNRHGPADCGIRSDYGWRVE
jgi:hypothetical protein